MVDPVGDRVVVRKDDEPTTTKGGIIMPDSSKKTPIITGVIVGISPKTRCSYDYSNITMYSRVLFDPRNAIPVSLETDNKRFVIPLNDIVAVFDSVKRSDDHLEDGVLCA